MADTHRVGTRRSAPETSSTRRLGCARRGRRIQVGHRCYRASEGSRSSPSRRSWNDSTPDSDATRVRIGGQRRRECLKKGDVAAQRRVPRATDLTRWERGPARYRRRIDRSCRSTRPSRSRPSRGKTWGDRRGVARALGVRYFVGTSRFSSSPQCCTTTRLAAAAVPPAALLLIIRNRCPSGEMSYVRPGLPGDVK